MIFKTSNVVPSLLYVDYGRRAVGASAVGNRADVSSNCAFLLEPVRLDDKTYVSRRVRGRRGGGGGRPDGVVRRARAKL